MTIKLEQAKRKTQIAVISIQGPLDASNYKELINVARHAKNEGAQYLYIDMSETISISSSGIFALYSIALLMRGIEPPNPEYGWNAYHVLVKNQGNGRQEKVKLLNPQQALTYTLDITGLKEFFEVLTHQETDTQMVLVLERLLTDPAICC